ncbi:MAG: DUF4199 domain-containing protein [Bacteroidales bacterium]
MEEQAKVPVFKAALIYGAIVGLASIVVSLLLYFIDQSLASWAMIASTLIFIGLIVFMMVLFRKEYGKGFASYGQLVLISFIVGLIAAILSAGYTFAIYEMDKGYLQDTKYTTIEKMDDKFDKMDARYQEKLSDDQYDVFEKRMRDQRKKQVKKIEGQTAFKIALNSIFGMVFMAVIVGLLAAIVIKKNPEPTLQ